MANLCVSHKPNFVFIAEPKIAFEQFPSNFLRRLNLKLFVANNRDPLIPNLWGFCATNLSPTVIGTSQQHVAFSMVHNNQ